MLSLSYERPVTQENLPALASSLFRLKTRVRRRKILSAVCGVLCFLLHTPLMIVASVGLYHRLAKNVFSAVLDSVPHVSEILTLCFRTLPAQIGLSIEMPELLGVPAAILLPPLLCVPVALLLRLCFLFGKKRASPEAVGAEELAKEARAMAEGSDKHRKARWVLFSALLSFLALAAAIVYSLLVVHPQSSDWDLVYITSYAFIALIAFFAFLLFADLTDSLTELLCALDGRWDASRLTEDLEGFLNMTAPGPAPDAGDPPPKE
ncbi:MAG: hypothetical protein IJP64_05960 [Oscillospiraceae bacterium]|nr:hypothetical protein [Oscillospiraceae bacterium]